MKDAIADITLQQVLTRPDEFDVIATHQPQRRLPVRRAGRAGRRHRHRARRQHQLRHRPRRVRGDPRHRAEVRGPGQGQPRFGDPVGRDDVRAPRLAGRGRRHRPRRSRRRSPTRSSPTTSPASWTARPRSRPRSSPPPSSTVSDDGVASGVRRDAPPTNTGARAPMVLAELNIRHTRRHQPTRRVAIGDAYLPTSGPALRRGAARRRRGRAPARARRGAARGPAPTPARGPRRAVACPRIAMRYRLQTDLHGLDRSRHRIVARGRPGRPRARPSRRGPTRRSSGAVMAAARVAVERPVHVAFRAIDAALRRPGPAPRGARGAAAARGRPRHAALRAGRGPEHEQWPRAGRSGGTAGGESDGTAWSASPPSGAGRWRCSACGRACELERTDVQARFRRLVRLAHPDHGARPRRRRRADRRARRGTRAAPRRSIASADRGRHRGLAFGRSWRTT